MTKKINDFKMYECVIDDGQEIFKTVIPAEDKKSLMEKWGGNGEFIRIQDVTTDYNFTYESIDEKLQNDLARCGWGLAEIRLICELARAHMENVKNN